MCASMNYWLPQTFSLLCVQAMLISFNYLSSSSFLKRHIGMGYEMHNANPLNKAIFSQINLNIVVDNCIANFHQASPNP
jgi:hypothetical protein